MPENPRVAEDGSLYRERLLPGPGTWIVLIVFALLLGPVIAPYPAWAAISISSVAVVVMILVAVVSAPVLEVGGGELRAGRAHVPVRLLGAAEVLDPEQWKRAMGPAFAPLEHHVTRGWIRTGVRIPLQDPEDPTPAWMLSTRRPDELAAALRAAAVAR